MAESADYRVPFQQANLNPISPNRYPHPNLHRLHGQNPHVAGDGLQGGHRWEGVPQQMGNVIMQGEMQYPQHVDVPNYYNAAHYYPPPGPPPQYPEDPHMYWNVEAVEAVPAQAQPFPPEPEIQENRDGLYGYGAHVPAAGPPEAFPGVQPHPAPPADMPPANGLRDLAGRFFNNPEAHVITLRIEPGPRGRFEVLIALELADLF